MNESILDSIKTLLGIELDDTSFDAELVLHINSVFLILNQLGVGSEKIFSITDSSDTWSEFFGDGVFIPSVKTYVFLRVRLLFDSNSMSSGLISLYKEQIQELEWRMIVKEEIG